MWSDGLGELARVEVVGIEGVPPVAADPVIGPTMQGLGCWGASGVDGAQWQVLSGMPGGETQVAVVGDQHSSIDLVSVEVDQEMRGQIHVRSLFLREP